MNNPTNTSDAAKAARKKSKQGLTPAECDCGQPAVRAGLPVKGAWDFCNACADCLRLESAMKEERRWMGHEKKSAGPEHPFSCDLPRDLSISINRACDAFMRRKGLPLCCSGLLASDAMFALRDAEEAAIAA